MKKSLLAILAIFLMTTGAAMAQSANTSAPGPTIQRDPGMNSNNLPNPGNPQTDLTRDRNMATTTTTNQEPTGGMDVDVDTGARANGAVDVDATMTQGDADTNATGIDETRTGPATQADDGSAMGTTSALPATASELPLLGIAGLLALASAFTARMARKA